MTEPLHPSVDYLDPELRARIDARGFDRPRCDGRLGRDNTRCPRPATWLAISECRGARGYACEACKRRTETVLGAAAMFDKPLTCSWCHSATCRVEWEEVK